jgi:predicted Rossmann fold flavoprotein
MNIAIIGAGPAGFFAAISAKENHPESSVIIFEKTQKLLSKVKVSGGGRCNVTNGCTSIKELYSAYPRGGKELKKAFQVFNTRHTRKWFEDRGVPLKVEADNRVFPKTNKSQTIIDCLLNETERLGIVIKTGINVQEIKQKKDQLKLLFANGESEAFDKVVVTTGGAPRRTGLEWLETLGHEIIDPLPSLFTFNMPKEPIIKLMGVVAENTRVHIQGTGITSEGPLLITHWGMSGPAILKLSSFGARMLKEMNYSFQVQINWVNIPNNDEVSNRLRKIGEDHPSKLLTNIKPIGLIERLWLYLIDRSGISEKKKWGELGKKGINKLTSILCNDNYRVSGKTTFKEEFVTCGGISLNSIDMKSMQSKNCKNLYFAGEILDIDGITGGYNFQAAWTTGYIAGKLE